MKTTQYFEYVKKRPDRAGIKEDWIRFVIENPERTETQSDGRIRKWAKIIEVDRYLRVILLEDGETVHNAFFDRSFKED
jgi:hypothetical protein